MSLYPDQEIVAKQFSEWMKSDQYVAGIWASAGFGKSHMMNYVVEQLRATSSLNIIITSMTHAACGVLEKLARCEVRTLHSVMGWVPTYDKATGEEFLKMPNTSNLKPNTILIIDEAGLCGVEECTQLYADVRNAGAKILFVGDNKQCYPVFKKDQKPCIPAFEMSETKMELTIPKRQDPDDYIYKLALVYRAAVDGERQPKLRTLLHPKTGKGIVHDEDDIEEHMLAMFAKAKRLMDSGADPKALHKIRALAFTNKKCIMLNRKIRNKVFKVRDANGKYDPRPFIGETLMSNKSVPSTHEENVVILQNNQYVTVSSVEEDEVQGLKGYWLRFQETEEPVFCPRSIEALKQRLHELAEVAQEKSNWEPYYRLKHGTADMRNTYAMTVNKAQGSTMQEVCIFADNFNISRDYYQKVRLMYTAVTRATHKVVIEGELLK